MTHSTTASNVCRPGILTIIGFSVLVVPLVIPGCGGSNGSAGATDDLFVDRATQSGLSVTHDNGARGDFFYDEIISGGGGLLDFDNDGDLDLYLVQTGPIPATVNAPSDRFFRNDGMDEVHMTPVFTDITQQTGIGSMTGHGMGIATGDFDNDGWIDVYVTHFGANVLLRNTGTGSFEDVTQIAAVGDPGLSTSALFADVDQDGWLDLFVVNYLQYTVETDKVCTNLIGGREYCGPRSYPASQDRLYHNLGDGRFEDWSLAAGIKATGAGLGVVAADWDHNGWIDLYVANDQTPNHLWLNQGRGQFVNEAMLRGSAVDGAGKAEASMGIDSADLDGDGDEDLFMTHLITETNTAYLNDGSAYFHDATAGTGLGVVSLPWTGFGTAFLDFDNDGWLDVMVANGAVRANLDRQASGDSFPYGEPNLLFRNLGQARFVDISNQAPVLALPMVSRGLAPGDIDNDGDTDLVVFNSHGPLQMLINQVGQRARWLGVRVLDPSGRDAIGAEIRLTRDDGSVLMRRVRTAVGYLSAADPRVLFGLDDDVGPFAVDITWIDGVVTHHTGLSAGRYHRISRTRSANP